MCPARDMKKKADLSHSWHTVPSSCISALGQFKSQTDSSGVWQSRNDCNNGILTTAPGNAIQKPGWGLPETRSGRLSGNSPAPGRAPFPLTSLPGAESSLHSQREVSSSSTPTGFLLQTPATPPFPKPLILPLSVSWPWPRSSWDHS